ncbi:hypothetical protein FRB99_008438 [Tulasnella sp. 403]|nr:hypothetical protein FRB99_008438 [Tulasnella sp. 403]
MHISAPLIVLLGAAAVNAGRVPPNENQQQGGDSLTDSQALQGVADALRSMYGHKHREDPGLGAVFGQEGHRRRGQDDGDPMEAQMHQIAEAIASNPALADLVDEHRRKHKEKQRRDVIGEAGPAEDDNAHERRDRLRPGPQFGGGWFGSGRMGEEMPDTDATGGSEAHATRGGRKDVNERRDNTQRQGPGIFSSVADVVKAALPKAGGGGKHQDNSDTDGSSRSKRSINEPRKGKGENGGDIWGGIRDGYGADTLGDTLFGKPKHHSRERRDAESNPWAKVIKEGRNDDPLRQHVEDIEDDILKAVAQQQRKKHQNRMLKMRRKKGSEEHDDDKGNPLSRIKDGEFSGEEADALAMDIAKNPSLANLEQLIDAYRQANEQTSEAGAGDPPFVSI